MWPDDLPAAPLDPSGRTPLHAQLTAWLRGRITDRTWRPGTVFPTEAELQERFSVSRSVVRQALAALDREGLIERGRGRGTTVAAEREHHRLVQRMPGLSTQIAREGTTVETAVLHLGPERNPRAEKELGTSEVIGVRRLRSAGGTPLALIHTWLPLETGGGLTATELTNASLHGVLRHRYGVALISGRRQIRAVPATPGMAGLLEVGAGEPLLLLEGTSFDEEGRPQEVFSTWHRADHIVFDIDVVRRDGPQPPGSSLSGAGPAGSHAVSPPELPTASGTPPGPELAERLHDLARQLELLSAEARAAGSGR